MNENIWYVSGNFRSYLLDNPNNNDIFYRAEAYGQLMPACFLCGIDKMDLTAEEVEVALKISRLTKDIDTVRLGDKIYKYNRDENPSALDLLGNASQRNYTRICLDFVMLINTDAVPSDNELYAAVAIARMLEGLDH